MSCCIFLHSLCSAYCRPLVFYQIHFQHKDLYHCFLILLLFLVHDHVS